jgi:hypothetical protein
VLQEMLEMVLISFIPLQSLTCFSSLLLPLLLLLLLLLLPSQVRRAAGDAGDGARPPEQPAHVAPGVDRHLAHRGGGE